MVRYHEAEYTTIEPPIESTKPENIDETLDYHIQPVITSTGVIDGFDNNAFIVTVIVIVGIAFILKLSYLQANNFVLWLQEDTRVEIANQVNQQISASDVRNLVTSQNTEDCPICYETFTLPVETNCRHTFCARCAIVCWETTEARGGGNTILSPLHCPMCRTEVSSLIPRYVFSEEQLENSDSAVIQHIKDTDQKVKQYNRRFSQSRRSWYDISLIFH